MEQLEPKSKRAKAYSEVDGLKTYSVPPVRGLAWVAQPCWLVGKMGSDHVLLYQKKLPVMETCGPRGGRRQESGRGEGAGASGRGGGRAGSDSS